MKNIERKLNEQNTPNNPSVKLSNQIHQLAHINTESALLSKVKALQNSLKHRYGFQLAKNTIHFLNLYCEYSLKLKQVITAQTRDLSKHKSFLAQFSRSHAQDHMSKLFMGIDSISRKIRRENVQFGRACLLTFFQLQNLSEDNVVGFLCDKIAQARANNLIDFQEKRTYKTKKSVLGFDDKENRIKNTQFIDSRKHLGDKYGNIHFEILALKVLLSNSYPDPVQTNKICQAIKTHMLNLFEKIKLKNLEVQLTVRKKGALDRRD